MTNEQLCLMIGVPMLINAILLGLFLAAMNARFSASFDRFNTRFDDMRDFWLAELHRFEEVLDARLKHLETR